MILDDLLSHDKSKLGDNVDHIYLIEPKIKDTTATTSSAS